MESILKTRISCPFKSVEETWLKSCSLIQFSGLYPELSVLWLDNGLIAIAEWRLDLSKCSLRLPTECRRIDAFALWCWRRLLRVPWLTPLKKALYYSKQGVIHTRLPEFESRLYKLTSQLSSLRWGPNVIICKTETMVILNSEFLNMQHT